MPIVRRLAVFLWVAAAACAPGSSPETPGDTPPLLASVQAAVSSRDTVRFDLQVTNTTTAPVDLEFSSGQTHDFIVSKGGVEVWRWSGDRMFTQALRTERLPAGETRTFSEIWTPPAGTSGEHTVRGVLTTRVQPTEQVTTFRIQ